jgi:hypothetical protein
MSSTRFPPRYYWTFAPCFVRRSSLGPAGAGSGEHRGRGLLLGPADDLHIVVQAVCGGAWWYCCGSTTTRNVVIELLEYVIKPAPISTEDDFTWRMANKPQGASATSPISRGFVVWTRWFF